MKLFLCEKPSQGRDIGRVLGARQRGDGCLRGDGVVVTEWVRAVVARGARQAGGAAPAMAAAGPVHACPDCGKPMRRKSNAKGHFWGCTGYPECRTALPDVGGKPGAREPRAGGTGDARTAARPSAAAAAPAAAGSAPSCPQCGRAMTQRTSARGPFWGCTGYPKCRGIVAA